MSPRAIMASVHGLGGRRRIRGSLGLNGSSDLRLTSPPCVEIATMRLNLGSRPCDEAGRAALQYGFECLELPEIVAFTLLAIKDRAA